MVWTSTGSFPPHPTQSNFRLCSLYVDISGIILDKTHPLSHRLSDYSQELRAAFVAEGQRTGKQRLILSAALHLLSDGGYTGSVLNK